MPDADPPPHGPEGVASDPNSEGCNDLNPPLPPFAKGGLGGLEDAVTR